MKIQNLLLFLILFLATKSELDDFSLKKCSEYESSKHAYSLDFCRSTQYDETTEKCCYYRYEFNGITYHHCKRITAIEFYNIDGKIDDLEKNTNIKVKELLCDSSSYLYSSLFLIFALLF